MEKYITIGVMSGTSLDGLDIILVTFSRDKNNWSFDIEKAHTYPYSSEWKNILHNIHYNTPAFELLKINQEYGLSIGNLINDFLKKVKIKPIFIASHGHTVFHQPYRAITSQIGDGNSIAAKTGLPVICDFRSKDVALGGQGAPLVPVGDKYLFPKYKYCMNLGGFANVSIKENDHIKAFDICPVNIILNFLVSDIGLEYDINGQTGSSGEVNYELLEALNKIEFYKKVGPKSLAKEWLEEEFIPVLYYFNISLEDKLRTIYSHIVEQIKNAVGNDNEKLLLTGGGVLNTFLVQLLKSKLKQEIILPSIEIISFKEALIFAFLGLLRWLGENNIFSSVTGSIQDNCGGAIYL